MTPLFLAFSIWMGYLGAEALRLRRRLKRIPLRITVTGTRGKTSVARMLAAVLRVDGRRVVAKTTGSQPRIVLPDGTERPVRRRGVPSILEQVRFLEVATEHRAQAVVVEIMSVHEENHLVESRKILQPHLVLVTNFRVDHVEAAGWSREEVAVLHLADITPGSTVVIPEGELVPDFAESVEKLGAVLIPVVMPKEDPFGSGAAIPGAESPTSCSGAAAPAATPPFLAENLALVRGAARELGVPEDAVIRGFREARGDLGAHWLRRYRLPDADSPVARGSDSIDPPTGPDSPGASAAPDSSEISAVPNFPGTSTAPDSDDLPTAKDSRTPPHPHTALTVNAFAANDPRSTELLLDWALAEAWGQGREPASGTGAPAPPAGAGEGGRESVKAPDGFPPRKFPGEIVGLMNLRADRGDRTVQWLEALARGLRHRFTRLYLAGFHAPALRRGLARRGLGDGVVVLREKDPARAMARILAESDGQEPLLFGFGNFGGLGEAMSTHWWERSEGAHGS